MLLTHTVAAMQGHEGPARNDHRARAARRRGSCTAPPFVTSHAPAPAAGPRARLGELDDRARGGQHLVFDAEVVDGLVYAYRARDALGLPAATVDAIRNAIHRTARGSFWRYPTIRLNQVNWYALMYAADATVTGDTDAAHARHARCSSSASRAASRGDAARAGNFGPGMRFHYLPAPRLNAPDERRLRRVREHRPDASRASTTRRGAPGMPALPRRARALLRAVDQARGRRLLDARAAT